MERQAPVAVSVCESSKHPNWMFFCGADGLLFPFVEVLSNPEPYFYRKSWIYRASHAVSRYRYSIGLGVGGVFNDEKPEKNPHYRRNWFHTLPQSDALR